MHNPPSLRRALLRYLLIPLSVLLLFSAISTYYIARNYSSSAYDKALLDSVETIEEKLIFQNGEMLLDLPQAALDVLGFDQQDETYFDVRRADGAIVAGNRDIPDPPDGVRKNDQAIFHDAVMGGKLVRVVSIYARSDDRDPDTQVLVQVAETLNKRETLAKEILSGVLIPQLVLVLLAAASVWFGIARSLVPLEDLHEAIRNRSHRDLSPIQEASAPLEVQPLVNATNDLMQRLSQALETQRHFIADAAHQLRTPLAGLATQTQLALRQTDPVALQHALGQIRVSAERTSHLVQQLLLLARVEAAPKSVLSFGSIDLEELARALTAEWVPRAMQKDIDLGYEGPGQPVRIRGQALLLREMVANVLDNALQYVPAYGKVIVRLIDGERPLLSIEDNGPGVPTEEHERVFERFHRVSGSGADGSGLGLAIVREIANAHGARVWLENAGEKEGARVIIQFDSPSVR